MPHQLRSNNSSMFSLGSHKALVAVGRPPLQAMPGQRRWWQAVAPAPLPMSTTPSRHSLVSRAAINIPPDALVHPFRKTFGSDSRWGIEKIENKEGKDEEIIKLWFQLTGVDVSKVKDEVVVDLPGGSNVLTIKQTKKAASAEEQLDVRLLLTASCSMDGITVRVENGKGDAGKVFLDVTIIRKITEFDEINIK